MAHEITAKDKLFYVGEKPWHGIGTEVKEALTASEAIIQAGLGWNVEGRNVYDQEGRELADYQAVTRQDTGDVFQVCKKSYTPVQNTEAFKIFDEVTGTGMAKYEVAGSLQAGRKIWMLARVPFDFKVGGRDQVNSYITLINGHDGSLALQMYQTPIRVVCMNTLRASLSSRTNVARAKHTRSGARNFTSRAQAILEQARTYFQEFAKSAQAMAEKEMKSLEIDSFLYQLFEVDPKASRAEIPGRTWNMMEDMKRLAYKGKGNAEFAGTAWAVYNGVTEYIDHERATRGADDNRLASSWLGSGADLRERAFELLAVR
jgi:phage/plasmid-like protein (TIGR03299 family)